MIGKAQNAYLNQILLHLGIGFVVYFFRSTAQVYFFAMVFYWLYRIIDSTRGNTTYEVLKACGYVIGSEVIFRMTNGAIFYEASKYLVILFIIFGMFYKGVSGRGYPYFIYLMALLPSVIVASINLGFDANFRTNVAFVLSGPICLGVAALFCYDKKVSPSQLLDVIKTFSLPVISMTVYLFLYTPTLKSVLTGTESNFATSGGFGPNQTSTVLGLGMFAFAVRYFLKSKSLFLKGVNIFFFMIVGYRAIITFSRGGVIAGLIVIFAFLIVLYSQSSAKFKSQIISTFLLLIVFSVITWSYSASRTEGLIVNRYVNKDALGREKNDISTGRVDLFYSELEGFVKNPFFGVGASVMKELRIKTRGKGIVSHNELSRVLSEHGIMGIFILLILIVKPLSYRSNNKKNQFFYAFLFFWFATINHSSMRIAAPAFIYALALLNVTNEKSSVRRQLPAK